jgi:hypothetical protein
MKRPRKPKFRKGQVVMARLDDVFVPTLVLRDPDIDFPTCVTTRMRRLEIYAMDRDRLRPLTARERGPRPKEKK